MLTSTVSAVSRLLGCAEKREGPPRPNSFRLKVHVTHSRARIYVPTEELREHPLLEMTFFPYEAECEHCPRLRAFACIRHQWEKETAELPGVCRQQGHQIKQQSQDVYVDCPCYRIPRFMRLREEGYPYWSPDDSSDWEEEDEYYGR